MSWGWPQNLRGHTFIKSTKNAQFCNHHSLNQQKWTIDLLFKKTESAGTWQIWRLLSPVRVDVINVWSLMLLTIYNEPLDGLNLTSVANKFIDSNYGRKLVSGTFKFQDDEQVHKKDCVLFLLKHRKDHMQRRNRPYLEALSCVK